MHGQHFQQRVSQFFQFGFIDVNKTAGLVDLMNHFGRILNQITIPFLQETDLFHLRIQLRKRLFQVDGHFIEGMRKRFNFIAGFQHEG